MILLFLVWILGEARYRPKQDNVVNSKIAKRPARIIELAVLLLGRDPD